MRLIGLLLGVGLALAARRRLDVVEVRGRSMAPALLPGDRLLVGRAHARPGDVVVASDPRDPRRELIKRVDRLDARGLHLRGDNRAVSTDGRAFGPLPADAVRWRVLLLYWPPARIGRVAGPPIRLTPVDVGGEPACIYPEALIAGR